MESAGWTRLAVVGETCVCCAAEAWEQPEELRDGEEATERASHGVQILGCWEVDIPLAAGDSGRCLPLLGAVMSSWKLTAGGDCGCSWRAFL